MVAHTYVYITDLVTDTDMYIHYHTIQLLVSVCCVLSLSTVLFVPPSARGADHLLSIRGSSLQQ